MEDKKLYDHHIALRGQLSVNFPVVVIILFASLGLSVLLDLDFKIALLIGFVLGWIYWSYSIKKWIQWAISNEVKEERLVKIGRKGMLIWSKNTVATVVKHNKTPLF